MYQKDTEREKVRDTERVRDTHGLKTGREERGKERGRKVSTLEIHEGFNWKMERGPEKLIHSLSNTFLKISLPCRVFKVALYSLLSCFTFIVLIGKKSSFVSYIAIF